MKNTKKFLKHLSLSSLSIIPAIAGGGILVLSNTNAFSSPNESSTFSHDKNTEDKSSKRFEDSVIEITDTSIHEISEETKPQILDWIKKYLSSNWSTYTDLNEPFDESKTFVFIRKDFCQIRYDGTKILRAHAYLSTLTHPVPIVGNKTSVEFYMPINVREIDPILSNYSSNDFNHVFDERTKELTLKYFIKNIDSFIIKAPENIKESDFSLSYYSGEHKNLFLNITYNFGGMSFTNKIYILFEIEGDFKPTFELPIGDGSNWIEHKSELENKLTNLDTYTINNKRYFPIGSKIKANFIEAKNDDVMYEITSNLLYVTNQIDGRYIPDVKENKDPITTQKVKITGYKTNITDDVAFPPSNKPNNPSNSNTGLVEDNGLKWWAYVAIVSSAVLVIAIIVVAIVVSKKKAKSKKQIKTQQYQRPVNQQVKTITTSTIPTSSTNKPTSSTKDPVNK